MPLTGKVEDLIKKGVRIPAPFSVEIGEEVSVERISGKGVVLYSGTKLYGAKTLICEGATIGYEAPATVVDCQVGPRAALNGGFFQAAVFLNHASLASGAHVREGSLLEEEAKAGHTVGLKQTLLFPFVTLGSLINFCDCLMAGGTSRANHSEVGSSYIHFNYSPQQDKATPSLIGDVPRGVMLNQRPIFLGGQGGLVGPLRIDYGTVTTAGTIWRHDSFGAKLLHGGATRQLVRDIGAGLPGDIRRKVYNNIVYIANILALKQWYLQVRRPFFLKRELGAELFAGAIGCLETMMAERLRRVREFSEKLAASGAIPGKEGSDSGETRRRQWEFYERWPAMEAGLKAPLSDDIGHEHRNAFLAILQPGTRGQDRYCDVIKRLDEAGRNEGTAWLQQIVDDRTAWAVQQLPSFSTYAT